MIMVIVNKSNITNSSSNNIGPTKLTLIWQTERICYWEYMQLKAIS